MMRRKTIFLTVMAAIFGVVIFSLPVLAAGSGQCGGGGGCGGGCMIDQIPNLTDSQKAQIKKLHLEFQKKMISMKAALATQELELKALLMEDAGETAVDAKIDEIHKIKAQIQKECYANYKALLKLLNDEQKKIVVLKHCNLGCCGGGGAKACCACCGGHSHCCCKHMGQSGCCGQGGQGRQCGQQKSGCEAMKAGKCPGHGATK